MPVSFLDLAAELRNIVYEAVLIHDRETGRIATVALLRTCRRIHAEAQGLLHAQSRCFLSISSGPKYNHHVNDFVGAVSTLNMRGDCPQPPPYRTTTSQRIIRILPPAMLHTQNIKVCIDVPRSSSRRAGEEESQAIGRFVPALWRFLNSNDKPRHLEVTLVSDEPFAGNVSKAIECFMGLVFLGPHVDLKLEGFDKEVLDFLHELRKETLGTSTGAGMR